MSAVDDALARAEQRQGRVGEPPVIPRLVRDEAGQSWDDSIVLAAEVRRLRKVRLCEKHYDGPDGQDHGQSLTCVLCSRYEVDRLRTRVASARGLLLRRYTGSPYYENTPEHIREVHALADLYGPDFAVDLCKALGIEDAL